MTTGKYSGQLVIDNDVTPVNDFAVTLLSEVVHLIANKGKNSNRLPCFLSFPGEENERRGKIPLADVDMLFDQTPSGMV